ncbi:hypothetical protein AK88_00658 [Plasmodium fragile]|uniref:Ribosomal protein L9 domain-containing protein n=1 Tax=Plasmodium fragile TaxID=5857 RepID=A0A0D9QS01_PLAFR|nr:uncharacterized protein AK88_00658 [Plasmodium fragile]KJP89698.1 hypothetical protein AK88_00658 [Plasmodium fragile]
MRVVTFVLLFCLVRLSLTTEAYLSNRVVKANYNLYAVRKKNKKKIPKMIHITVSADNEIGTKGDIKKVKLSHAFNYIIPQKLGYRSTIDELVEKEKTENTLKYIDEIKRSFLWTYKKKLDGFNVPFQFAEGKKILVTQDHILHYLLTRGLIRENDDVYDKIKSKKVNIDDVGSYPMKYTFMNNLHIELTVHVMRVK